VSTNFTPSRHEIAQITSTLVNLVFDPDAYWSKLVDLLGEALVPLTDAHVDNCILENCRTCRQLGQIWIPLAVHVTIQPTGCPCPNCRAYPARIPMATAN
jgi:hypothetical protein